MANEFGLTNDEQELIEVATFRDAAIADGWDAKPGGSSEPLEVYAHLEKEGFKMHAMCRRNAGKWKFQTNIHIWGTGWQFNCWVQSTTGSRSKAV
jgi:hypothetical protein